MRTGIRHNIMLKTMLAGAAAWMAVLIMAAPVVKAADSVNELLIKGNTYHLEANFSNAAAVFRQVIAREPRNIYARNQLGLVLMKQDKTGEAIGVFNETIRLNPEDSFSRLWLGILTLDQGEIDRALDMFKALVRLDPQNANAHYFLGAIYQFKQDYAGAIDELDAARSLNSSEATTHFRLAEAYHSLGLIKNATLEYQRTLEIDPDFIGAYDGLGWIELNSGRTGEAIELWKTMLKKSPGNIDAVHNIAWAYNEQAWAQLQAGDRTKARQLWQKTLQYNPGNKEAKYNLGKYK